jgi:hypothetical protein
MYITDTIHDFVVKDVEKEIKSTKEVDDNMLKPQPQSQREFLGIKVPLPHENEVNDFNT